MATKKDSINFNRNPLVDVCWQGTISNCQQVLDMLTYLNFTDGVDQDATMGLVHVHNMLKDALNYEFDTSIKELKKA